MFTEAPVSIKNSTLTPLILSFVMGGCFPFSGFETTNMFSLLSLSLSSGTPLAVIAGGSVCSCGSWFKALTLFAWDWHWFWDALGFREGCLCSDLQTRAKCPVFKQLWEGLPVAGQGLPCLWWFYTFIRWWKIAFGVLIHTVPWRCCFSISSAWWSEISSARAYLIKSSSWGSSRNAFFLSRLHLQFSTIYVLISSSALSNSHVVARCLNRV